jgi:hypothetical protein
MSNARYGVTIGLFCLIPALVWTLSHDLAAQAGHAAAVLRGGGDALWLAQNIALILALPAYAAKHRFVDAAWQSAVIVAVALPFQALAWATGAAPLALALRVALSLVLGLALAATASALHAAATRLRPVSLLTPALQVTACVALLAYNNALLR